MSFPVRARWIQDLRQYEIGESLGTGNFTEVFICTEKATGRKLAIKEVNREKVEKLNKQKDVLMEKHCLQRMRHPNVVVLHNTFRCGVNLYIITELCVGDLWKEVFRVGIPEYLAQYYFAQLLNAIEYLHVVGIVHRDLKAENIMVQKPAIIKVIDFGSAKDLRNPQVRGAGNIGTRRQFHDYVGTPNFMAPEMIRNKFSDTRCDLWSIGCTLFQCLTGLPPFASRSEYLTYVKAMSGEFVIPASCSEVSQDLMRKLVVLKPDCRLGAIRGIGEIKAHPFFLGVSFADVHRRPRPILSLVDCCLRTVAKRHKVLAEELEEEEDRYDLITQDFITRPDLSEYIRNHLRRILRNVVLEHKMHPEQGHEEDDEDKALVKKATDGKFGDSDSDDDKNGVVSEGAMVDS